MTGTGTETDPYIVDNWDDFVTAIGTAGAYVAFPEGGGTIDMNDVQSEGITSSISAKCTSVQGNGWKIKNIYVLDCALFAPSSNTLKIYNLDFIDMYIKSVTASAYLSSFGTYTGMSFNNCKLTGILAGMNTNYYASITDGLFNACSLFFDCKGKCVPSGGSSTSRRMVNSQLKLTGTCDAFMLYLDNSYLSGNIDMNGNITVRSNSTASVINANITYPESSTYGIAYTGTLANAVVINTDLVTNGTISANLNQVTTEQLTDAAYLSSIGFPIGVD